MTDKKLILKEITFVHAHLEKLNRAVEFLARQPEFQEKIRNLEVEVNHSPEPFVWSVVELDSLPVALPENIRSGWIFVLKKNTGSGCHYHPNSVQHMVVLKGQGRSHVAGLSKRMFRFQEPGHSLEEIWYVIDENTPHEFFPEEENMVVVSFHTCGAGELEEISCESGGKRLYEGKV